MPAPYIILVHRKTDMVEKIGKKSGVVMLPKGGFSSLKRALADVVHGTIPFSNRAISDLEIAAASPRMAPSRVLSRFRGGKRLFELLESTHLIYRLPPLGYGKEVLRGRFKIYLANAAIAPAVLLKGKAILEDTTALGVATETDVFKHLFARYHAQNARFSYWRGKKDQEVDLVAEVEGEFIPLEVEYRVQHAGTRELRACSSCAKAGG